jgi:rhamnulokinase
MDRISTLKKEGAFIAVDLGAGSGRVLLAEFKNSGLELEMIHRFHSHQHVVDGHERWDIQKIFSEIEKGLALAIAKKPNAISVGADSWGVDYGWIDDKGQLIADPVCYRDNRTVGQIEKVATKMSLESLYARTGIPTLIFNSIYQLGAEVEAKKIPKNAKQFLMIPDLVHHFLTGLTSNEYTDSSTSQLLSSGERRWDRYAMEKVGIPDELFAEPMFPGSTLGPISSKVAKSIGSSTLKVVLPASHDTASAVVGTPLRSGTAFLSSGTWSLIGLERKEALLTDEARKAGFSNEGGAYHTYRFLKNVMGLWILESCRKIWKEQNLETDYGTLIKKLESLPHQGFIFPDHGDFFNPDDATQVLKQQLESTGQKSVTGSAEQAKVIFDSLAMRYASVLNQMEKMTGEKINEIRIVGGGSQNDYLNQQTADATGRRVVAGPLEATAIGNVLVQALAAGCFNNLRDARAYVESSLPGKVFEPRVGGDLESRRKIYLEVEKKLSA